MANESCYVLRYYIYMMLLPVVLKHGYHRVEISNSYHRTMTGVPEKLAENDDDCVHSIGFAILHSKLTLNYSIIMKLRIHYKE